MTDNFEKVLTKWRNHDSKKASMTPVGFYALGCMDRTDAILRLYRAGKKVKR